MYYHPLQKLCAAVSKENVPDVTVLALVWSLVETSAGAGKSKTRLNTSEDSPALLSPALHAHHFYI